MKNFKFITDMYKKERENTSKKRKQTRKNIKIESLKGQVNTLSSPKQRKLGKWDCVNHNDQH